MQDLLIFSLNFYVIIEYTQGWSFDNEDPWPEQYCKKGLWQSPIDIVDDDSIMGSNVSKLSLENLDQVYDATLVNDGHKVRIFLNAANIKVFGGRLPGVFKFDHIGIHWNSGHTVNGERKALEVTFLFCNILFEDCDEAQNYAGGATLLSTLYEFQDEDNEILDAIMNSLDEIVEAHSTSKIKLNPRSLLPKDLTIFYRYWGSFTRPNCIEGKPWTIFEELCKISQKQVNQFMKLKGENGELLKKAHRSTQNCNQRPIFKIKTL